jgi:hypothetical protein
LVFEEDYKLANCEAVNGGGFESYKANCCCWTYLELLFPPEVGWRINSDWKKGKKSTQLWRMWLKVVVGKVTTMLAGVFYCDEERERCSCILDSEQQEQQQ